MKNILRWILLVLFLTYGVACNAEDSSSPTIAKVGIQLLSIDQLDLYRGTYAMDFHLIFTCNKKCPKFQLEVLNGMILSIKEEASEPNKRIYRVKANLEENFNAKYYPFDKHKLRLELKDQLLDKSKVILTPDPKLMVIDSSVILHGWEFDYNLKAHTSDYKHPLLKKTYTAYLFTIELVRPPLMGFLKVLFPAIIIIFFAFISFFIRPDKAYNRFGIVSGTLLGSVIFHLNLTSSLPPLGYLTYVDMLMIINYTIIFLILFENVYLMRLEEAEKLDLAKRFDKISIIGILLSWLILQVTNALVFFL